MVQYHPLGSGAERSNGVAERRHAALTDPDYLARELAANKYFTRGTVANRERREGEGDDDGSDSEEEENPEPRRKYRSTVRENQAHALAILRARPSAEQMEAAPPAPAPPAVQRLVEDTQRMVDAAKDLRENGGRRRRFADWSLSAEELEPAVGEKLTGKVRASVLNSRARIERELTARGITDGWVATGQEGQSSFADLKKILIEKATYEERGTRFLVGGRVSPEDLELSAEECGEVDAELSAQVEQELDADGAAGEGAATAAPRARRSSRVAARTRA